jgi:tetratricopeptide (TPR) repeat protein
MGLRHHRLGRWFLAETCYRRILQVEPGNAEALHLLGLIAQQRGNCPAAVQLIGAAIRINPAAAHYYNNLGNTYVRMAKRVGERSSAGRRDPSLLLPHPAELQLALKSYWRALELLPDYAEAYYNLGHALQECGELAAACSCHRRAVNLKPGCARFHCGLGRVLGRLGDPQAAEEHYRRVLEIDPGYAEAQHKQGDVLLGRGELEEAADHYGCALALKPHLPETHCRLAETLAKRGDLAGAAEHYHRAAQLRPGYAHAYTGLAIVLEREGNLIGAEQACRQAVLAQPDSAAAHNNLASVLERQSRLAESAESCRYALRLNPTLAEAHNNLASVLWRQNHLTEAVASCRAAISLKPDCAAAYCNLGSVLTIQGNLDEGLRCYRRVLELEPDSAAAAYYSGLTDLLQGNLTAGWQAYEHRWRLKRMQSGRREFAQPLWRGEPLDGASILLWAEQGLGDVIQFVRYAPLVAARGGRVILEVPQALHRLLSTVEGAAQVVVRGGTLPSFAWQCPLMSLPLAFRTELATIPANVPYLNLDPAAIQAWSQRLHGEGLRVGLVWAGNPKHMHDRQRSLALAQLAPLTPVADVSFYALQKGPAAAEMRSIPAEGRIVDLGPQQADMADTAAIIANLDLVISVDTSVAHLAGALGKPVWIPLPHVPDWRWLLGREDSPWYPTARLFRQSELDDWKPVIERLAAELACLVERRGVLPSVEAPGFRACVRTR